MLALVTKSKPIYKNALGYDTKTKEYVYLHARKEVWRRKSIDGQLFNYFNNKRTNNEFVSEDELSQLAEYPIYQQYSDSCQAS